MNSTAITTVEVAARVNARGRREAKASGKEPDDLEIIQGWRSIKSKTKTKRRKLSCREANE